MDGFLILQPPSQVGQIDACVAHAGQFGPDQAAVGIGVLDIGKREERARFLYPVELDPKFGVGTRGTVAEGVLVPG